MNRTKRNISFVTVICAYTLFTHVAAAATGLDNRSLAWAEETLSQEAAKADRSGVGSLLDNSFEWTDADGQTRVKEESLQAGPVFFKSLGLKDPKARMYNYGSLGVVGGETPETRFLHIWAGRPNAWRLIVNLETPILPTVPRHAAVAGDCDNPCRTLPYTPDTAMDKAIVATWQQEKVDEWHPNPDEWERGIADEFMIINSTSSRNKSDRVEIARNEKASGVGAPGDPIISMRIMDFGDRNALMLSRHFPYRGGKPYYNVRVWIYRDERWQLAISQQTTIEADAPLPGVAKREEGASHEQ